MVSETLSSDTGHSAKRPIQSRPGVRDILIEHAEDYPFELFSEFYSHNVTINWQFDEMDAVSSDSSDTILHSIFEKHIRKVSNWTVSSEFKSRFPEMVSAVEPLR